MKMKWILVFAVCVFVSAGVSAQVKQVPQSRQQVQLSYAPLVKKVSAAVVNIYTTKITSSRRALSLFNDPFFKRFFGENLDFGNQAPTKRRRQNSLGSGVIIDPSGLIITNVHVIEGADEITVVLADRREFEAKVMGKDKRTDLAVIRIDTKGEKLTHLKMRDSDDLEVGDIVLAIGNPFGVGQTVTSGIVSALARTQVGINDLNFFIQTDAAINPGNSGGALVSLDGRLVGVNSAIFSKSGGSHGIGFAILSNMVRSVVAGIAAGGRLVRPWLGAWGGPVTAEIAASLGMPRPVGVLVTSIYPKGPASQAGLKRGDVLVAVNGREINDPNGLIYRISTLPVGSTAKMTVLRRGREQTFSIRLVPPPENPKRDQQKIQGRNPLSGAIVANMSPALADELRAPGPFSPGVYVLAIRRGTHASRLGFKPGDRVDVINGVKIDLVSVLQQQLKTRPQGWSIAIRRGGQTLRLELDG
ncbi:MAG: Do family serine endopeptidase [Rhodospirillaceae bacterium]|nr:Do family serine endopeptidase [Rhodospirillaceae bacterium]